MNSLSDRRVELSPRMVSNGSPRGGGGRERSRSAEGSRHRARSFSRSRSRERVVVGDSGADGRGGGRRSSYRRSYRSRSRSRDYYNYNDYDRHYYYESHRSPMSRGRRYMGNSRVSPPYAAPDRNHRYSSRNDMSRGSSRFMQENPGPNKCLGVFGLSLRTTERDLREVFSRYGPIEECTVVIDAQTGRSRGFAFIYFETLEDSKAAKESCNGIEIDGRRIRVDFSITQRAHTPTPGIYMGKPTYNSSRRRDDYRGSYRRSPSPYHGGSSSRRGSRRGHSRSRSYSPRRY